MAFNKRLDKSRDFGTNCPPENGVFYWQDGYPFDHEGHIVESQLTKAQREALAKLPARKPAPAAPAPVQGKPKPPVPASEAATGSDGDAPKGDDDASANQLNLTGWLTEEEDYPFPEVQAAVKERFSVWKTGKRDLVLFLVEDQKLVTQAELSDNFKKLIA